MRSSINHYEQSANAFDTAQAHARSFWDDNVGATFYSQIVEPMKQESQSMKTAMEDCVSQLERIKSEIESI